MRNKPLPGMINRSPMKHTQEKRHAHQAERKELKRVSFEKKKGTLKKKGLNTLDFDDTTL